VPLVLETVSILPLLNSADMAYLLLVVPRLTCTEANRLSSLLAASGLDSQAIWRFLSSAIPSHVNCRTLEGFAVRFSTNKSSEVKEVQARTAGRGIMYELNSDKPN